MKSWKKLLALLMALAMVFALAACDSKESDDDDDKKSSEPSSQGDPEPNEPGKTEPEEVDLDGKWAFELNYNAAVSAALTANWGTDVTVDAEFPLTINIEFDGDECVFTYKVDKDDLNDFANEYLELTIEQVYLTMEAEYGMTRAEVDAAMAQDGTTVEAESAAGVQEELLALIDAINDIETERYFKVEDDKIYIAEDEDDLEDVDDADASMEFQLKGSKLTIKDIEGDIDEYIEEILDIGDCDFPWTFKEA